MGCVKKGGKGSSCPWGVSRGVGKGVGAHGVCQDGWERDFPPTGCVKKGGKGSSRPWGEFLPMGCVKKGGKGISHPRGVSSQKKSPNRCGTVGAFFRLSFL